MNTRKLSSKPIRWSAGIVISLFLLFCLFACPTTASLYGDAYARYIAQDEEQALTLLERVLKNDPAYVPAYILQSAILRGRGELEAAAAILVSAKEKAPLSAVVCYNLGNIYFKKTDYAQALTEYSRALELDPQLVEAYLNRANCRMAVQDYKTALADYETFLKLSVRENPDVRKLVERLRIDFPAAMR